MKKILALVLTTVLAMSVGFPSVTFAAAEPKVYNVTLLPETYQTIEGWGVYPAAVPSAGRDWWSKAYAVHNALFDELGINLYRVELKGQCGDGDGNLVQSELEMFRTMIRVARDHGQEDYLVSIWTPPAGMKDNNNIAGQFPDGRRASLLPAYEQKFCNYIVNVLHDLEANDLPLPKALSIQNEPNNAFPYQSCYYSGEQYRRVAKLMRKTLDAAGYTDIQLAGAEAPSYSYTPMWFGEGNSELENDPELDNAIGILASHSYNDPTTNTKANIDAYVAGLKKFPQKQVWETEFSTIHGASTTTQIDRAIDGLRTFTTDVTWVGSNAWFWWLGWGDYRYKLEGEVSPTDARQRRMQESLLDNNGTANDEGRAGTEAIKGILFHAFATVWNNAPAGSKVMRLTTDDPAVVNTSEPESDLLGFKTPDGNNVVLFINPSDEDKTYNFNGLSGTSAEVYNIVSDTENLTTGNLAPEAKLNMEEGGTIKNVVIPARSINVIVTKTEDVAPPLINYVEEPTVANVNGQYVSRSQSLDVKFQLDETADVEFNGTQVPLSGDLSFTRTINFSTAGETKDVTVSATDQEGNTASKVYTFKYDPTYVHLALDETESTVKTNLGTYVIAGDVNVPSTITIKDGVGNTIGTAVAGPGLHFSYEAPLNDGENRFVISAAANTGPGVSSDAALTVLCSRNGPVITLDDKDLTTSDSEFIFTGRLSKMPETFTVNGQDMKSRIRSYDLSFAVKVTLGAEGDNAITFRTTDDFGNIQSVEKTVTYTKTKYTPKLSGIDANGNKLAYVGKAKGTITVDGKLDEADWLVDIKANKGIQGIPKNITNFGVLWDENYLYIGVRVYDTNVRFDDPSNRPYMNDGIELFLNPGNSKATQYGAKDKQLFITRTNGTVYNNGAGYLSGWDTIAGGYTCEFAIPWSSMGISNPTDGIKIGFDIQNDDREQTNTGVTRESQIIWSGTSDNWQNTSKFGTLILDENYTLEVGAPVAGGMGQTQTVTINGSNVSSKYLAVRYLEGTGSDAMTTVYVINASPTVTLSYPNTGTVLDVWLTDGFPNLVDESLGARIYNQEP